MTLPQDLPKLVEVCSVDRSRISIVSEIRSSEKWLPLYCKGRVLLSGGAVHLLYFKAFSMGSGDRPVSSPHILRELPKEARRLEPKDEISPYTYWIILGYDAVLSRRGSVDISGKHTASIFKLFRGIYPEDWGRMIYVPNYTASELKKATTRIFTILQALTSHRHKLTSFYCHRLFSLPVVNFTTPSIIFLGNASPR